MMITKRAYQCFVHLKLMFVYCRIKVVVPQMTAQIRKQENVQAA
jgi:hypothetical protein